MKRKAAQSIGTTTLMLRELALVPFGYLLVSRVKTARDLAYLFSTQLVPGAYLTVRLSDLSSEASLILFAAGYVAFLSIYETGYLVNDAWDAKLTTGGRLRVPFPIEAWFIIAFVGIRLLAWFAISWWFQRLDDDAWLAMSMGLIGAFSLHNYVKDNTHRLATFVQLTLLRFAMPVVFVVGSTQFVSVLLISSILYLHFRGLAYLDSKDLLVMPGRRKPAFGLTQTILFFPLIAVICVVQRSFIYGEVWGYYCAVYTLWYFLSRIGQTRPRDAVS